MPASAGPLRIGGNAVWNEWFSGQIDEDPHVYERTERCGDRRRPRPAGRLGLTEVEARHGVTLTWPQSTISSSSRASPASPGFQAQGRDRVPELQLGRAADGHPGTGGGGSARKVQMQDFHFTMTINKAVPKLFLACVLGAATSRAASLTARKATKEQQEFHEDQVHGRPDLVLPEHGNRRLPPDGSGLVQLQQDRAGVSPAEAGWVAPCRTRRAGT